MKADDEVSTLVKRCPVHCTSYRLISQYLIKRSKELVDDRVSLSVVPDIRWRGLYPYLNIPVSVEENSVRSLYEYHIAMRRKPGRSSDCLLGLQRSEVYCAPCYAHVADSFCNSKVCINDPRFMDIEDRLVPVEVVIEEGKADCVVGVSIILTRKGCHKAVMLRELEVRLMSLKGSNEVYVADATSCWSTIHLYTYSKTAQEEEEEEALRSLRMVTHTLSDSYSILLLYSAKKLESIHRHAKRMKRSRTVMVDGTVMLNKDNFSCINCNGIYTVVIMLNRVCMVQDHFTKEWEFGDSKYMGLRGFLAISEESILIAECYVSKDRINIIDNTIIKCEESVSSNQKGHKQTTYFCV